MKKFLFSIISLALLSSCATTPSNVQEANSLPSIYPDYTGVTIPAGIAPLNFAMADDAYDLLDVNVVCSDGTTVHSQGVETDFNLSDWHSLVRKAVGDSLMVNVLARTNGQWTRFRPFPIYVSNDSLPAYGLTYRRIPPGYKVYNIMGTYQRELASFDETPIFQSSELNSSCVNCHTANRGSNEQYLFHVRGANGGTVISNNGKVEILNGKSSQIFGSLVYPSWHPGGRFVACSTNDTKQGFYMEREKRIEVSDIKSDLFVYDVEKNTILSSPLLNHTDGSLETFPAFSADGSKIYFCSLDYLEKVRNKEEHDRYFICSIDFDAENGSFGTQVDTIVDLRNQYLSIALPRLSPDGRHLMFTTCDYGTFPIWHKEADLWLMNLESKALRPINEVNSDNTESFHNWSNNSRWFVFSSRRDDGWYTRLYIAHCSEDGTCTKPFMLPQRSPKNYYRTLFDSYNTPDFSIAHIDLNDKSIADRLVSGDRKIIE